MGEVLTARPARGPVVIATDAGGKNTDMEVGFAVPVSGSWAVAEGGADRIRELAQAAEAAGYASLWTFQRLLTPVGADGRPTLDPQYRSVHDPLVVLGYLAAATTRSRLGVAVVNAPYYPPVLLAKMLTTIDHLARGRLDVGIGVGWLPDEFAAVGVPRAERGARTDELLRCLAAIWTDDIVSYQGRFFTVPRSRIDPKPLQRPHPPLLLGGAAEAALRRAGRTGAGWVSSSRADLDAIGDSIAVVRGEARRAGRDPDGLRMVCRAVVKVRDVREGPLTGSLDDIRRDLGRLAQAGVTEAFVDLNFDPQVASPDADPDAAFSHAGRVLQALAPAG